MNSEQPPCLVALEEKVPEPESPGAGVPTAPAGTFTAQIVGLCRPLLGGRKKNNCWVIEVNTIFP